MLLIFSSSKSLISLIELSSLTAVLVTIPLMPDVLSKPGNRSYHRIDKHTNLNYEFQLQFAINKI